MRKIIGILTILLTSCTTISHLNSNMEASNSIIAQNTELMQEAKVAIEENTRQIKRSTEAMRDFQFVFPVFFSILLLIFISLLFKLYKMIGRKMRK